MQKSILFLLALLLTETGCKSDDSPENADPAPEGEVKSVTIDVDRSVTFQEIDGFGFFGARNFWWDGNEENLYSETWATQVIEDLGITIWRNEYYPPSTTGQTQDANWEKQKPVVVGLKKVADENNVPLKFVFTVWSPPADLKCALDDDNNPLPDTPHEGGTKEGGTLNPEKYNEFGNWLAEGLHLYKDSGIDVYALSPQNEPLFKQSFNSCYYKPQGWYGDMLKNVVPIVKATFPDVKIFGSENMLEIEAGNDRQWFYHANLLEDPEALAQLDIWAVHGYAEGVTPTASSELINLWNVARTEHFDPTDKPVWMTETSGYSETWQGTSSRPAGAFDLAMDMHTALFHGKISAWIWWQGSLLDGINDYSLMQGTTTKGKKYYVSKHFYRFIRPGAKMIKTTYHDEDGVFSSTYIHEEMGAFTMVLINTNDQKVEVSLAGKNLPDTFEVYQTTSASDNCTKKDPASKDSIILPPSSVVTLVNGSVFE